MQGLASQIRSPGSSAASSLLRDLGAAVTLAAALVVVFVLDQKTPALPALPHVPRLEEPPPPPPPPPPPLASPRPIDPTPRVRVQTTPEGRFGLVTLSGNPDDPSDDQKRLTFHHLGLTNNTRVLVDGRTPLFGSREGTTTIPPGASADEESVMVWEFRDVRVRQTLRLVAGDISRRTDSLRVSYTLENVGQRRRNVGLRVMLDTLIGDNDGVPFLVPGREGLITRPLTLEGRAVPDFVQSLERDDLTRPGVVVDIGLSLAEGEERPGLLTLTHWPGEDADWDYSRDNPFVDDTAVGLYYLERSLAPGASRSMGFTYGLGTLSSTASRNPSLSLTTSGPIRAGSSFWLMVLVKNPKQGQSVALMLPAGLKPLKPTDLRQQLAAGGAYTQLSWLIDVAPTTLGQVEVKAALDPTGVTERQTLMVQPADVQLALLPRGPYRAGRPFWVSAVVRNPRAGQVVTLALPDGLTLAGGHRAARTISADELKATSTGFMQFNWLVMPGPHSEGRRTMTAALAPGGAEARADVEVSPANLTQ